MSATVTRTGARSAATFGQSRHDPKLEMWFAWWVIIAFYNVFTIAFFVLSRTQPPPKAWWALPHIVQWFNHNHAGILIGFAMIFLIAGFSLTANALIAYSMRRMSVSPVFAYSYLIIYSLAGIPGMLLTCIALTVGAMRPDRDPRLIGLLYDMGFCVQRNHGHLPDRFARMGCCDLIDNNRVLPKWFGYLNLCNALTEVVVAPCCMFKSGPLAWDGVIAWYINMVVFGIYTGAFIMLLRNMIIREDFGTGVMPDLPQTQRP